MLANIKAHSLVVAQVARTVVDGLARGKKNGSRLPDLDLVLSGALLHDIAKTQCLNNECDHARVGREICEGLGFPAIAEIVREHVILKDFPRKRLASGTFLAKEIVYYADKRVRHDEIVTLDQRLAYIIGRYGNNDPIRHDLIRENFRHCEELEEFLFAWLDFPPEDLADQVSCSPNLIP